MPTLRDRLRARTARPLLSLSSRAPALVGALVGVLVGVLGGVLAAGAPAAAAEDPLRVVVTVPELEDVVTRVGGDLVDVQCLTRGVENLHSVRLRPSFLVATSKADLFVQVGLSLEHAWVPGLIESSRNVRLRGDGLVTVGEGMHTLDVPRNLSRQQGTDMHPQGNPHVNLDPRFGPRAARVVHDALLALRPGQAEALAARRDAYLEEVEVHARRWRRVREVLAGRGVVEFHAEHRYLFASCGLVLVGTLEVKPGVPPTPAHLARLVERMREHEVRLVVHSPWGGQRVAADVAEETGATLLELPSMAGTREDTRTWIGLMDHLHDALLAAYGVELPPEEAPEATPPRDGEPEGEGSGGGEPDDDGGGRPRGEAA